MTYNLAPYLEATQQSFWEESPMIVKFYHNNYVDWNSKNVVLRLAPIDGNLETNGLISLLDADSMGKYSDYIKYLYPEISTEFMDNNLCIAMDTILSSSNLPVGIYKVQIGYIDNSTKYIQLTEKPADWDTNYNRYYEGNNSFPKKVIYSTDGTVPTFDTEKIYYSLALEDEITWSNAVRISKLAKEPEILWNEDARTWSVSGEALRRYKYMQELHFFNQKNYFYPDNGWYNGLIPQNIEKELDRFLMVLPDDNAPIYILGETTSGLVIKFRIKFNQLTSYSDLSKTAIDTETFPDKIALYGIGSFFQLSKDKKDFLYLGTRLNDTDPPICSTFIENDVPYYFFFQDENKNTMSVLFPRQDEIQYYQKDYEYPYLCDKENSLCLKFNGNVSSFKRNYQTTKQETLGGEYPYIFRNNKMRYAEMPFTAIISSDLGPISNAEYAEEQKAISRISTNDNLSSGLTPAARYRQEKLYRDEVYNWLNNGKPKVFKSATEGLFLVQVLDGSLTPKTELGNMLYEVSATLCEIGEITAENLMRYGLI